MTAALLVILGMFIALAVLGWLKAFATEDQNTELRARLDKANQTLADHERLICELVTEHTRERDDTERVLTLVLGEGGEGAC